MVIRRLVGGVLCVGFVLIEALRGEDGEWGKGDWIFLLFFLRSFCLFGRGLGGGVLHEG